MKRHLARSTEKPLEANSISSSPNCQFSHLALSQPIRKAIQAAAYEEPTPIQAQSIPHLLKGRDLLGIAQTGTGKTAAFLLPLLQALDTSTAKLTPACPKALILTPTRELASQIAQSAKTYGKFLRLRHTVIFGGVTQKPQVRQLQQGIDLLVATPGRLIDLMGQGELSLRKVEIFVLDEADRMLDMGFLRDVRKIIAELPHARQNLLFSATMPEDIVRLANNILKEPVRVEVTPPATTVDRVEQRVLFVEKPDKRKLLAELLSDPSMLRSLVFSRTKHGADRAVKFLKKAGIKAEAIHGNKSQSARERALSAFRAGKVHVLVATDIAARGIDIPSITHVINFDLPNVPEDYVHRIGRTARAGRDGIAISFCDNDERAYLRAIEKKTKQELKIVKEHPFRSKIPFEIERITTLKTKNPRRSKRSGRIRAKGARMEKRAYGA